MTEKPRFWWFLGSGGVPYTGILGKKSPKNLIPHQRFSWIFDLWIYGGSDPIYGDLGQKHSFWSKIGYFSHISLCAKFNRFFIILGGVANPVYTDAYMDL